MVEEDENALLAIDFEAELLPTGRPDCTSPTSFDRLLSTAQCLFIQMQNAYAIKYRALQEVSKAKNVEKEKVKKLVLEHGTSNSSWMASMLELRSMIRL